MPLYRISNAYWDGTHMHKPGSKLEFALGRAPRGSELIEAEAAPPAEAPAEEPPPAKPVARVAPKKE